MKIITKHFDSPVGKEAGDSFIFKGIIPMACAGFIIITLLSHCSGTPESKTNNDTILSDNPVLAEAEETPVKVSIDDPANRTERISASGLFKSTRYIPLETTEEALLDEVVAVEECADGYYVATRDNLALFGDDGRFIRRIGKPGNGPGEYNMIADIAADISDNSLFILSIMRKEILHYSSDGTLLKSIKIERSQTADKIGVIPGKGIYLLFSDMIQESLPGAGLFAAEYSFDGTMKRYFKSPLPSRFEPGLSMMIPGEVLFGDGEDIFAMQVRNDTLYRITADEIRPYIIFDYHEMKLPDDRFTMETFRNRLFGDDYLYFQKVLKANGMILFSFKYHKLLYRAIFNVSDKTLRFTSLTDGKGYIHDDRFMDIPFWPVSVTTAGDLLSLIEPSALSDEQLEKISTGSGKVSITDNPVIQIAALY
jgi:hypothetical protein